MPVKVGLFCPYVRDALLAVTVSGAWFTSRFTLAVALVKWVVSVGVKVTVSGSVPALSTVPEDGL